MCILLLFNNHHNEDESQPGSLTFKEIQQHTGIEKDALLRHLLSLAHPKVKILKKDPNKKECENDHKFKLNTKFKSSNTKFNVPLLPKRPRPATAPVTSAIERVRFAIFQNGRSIQQLAQ